MIAYVFAIVGLIVVSYFFGNINFSVIISKFNHSDIRTKGSGNPGTINMLRSFGIKLGALTFVLDAIKGALPALIGWYVLGNGVDEMFVFGDQKLGLFIGALSVVIGHIFPVFFDFKGGKGVACTVGVCFVITPIITLISFVIGVTYLCTVRIGSLTSFVIISIPILYHVATSISSGVWLDAILALIMLAIVVVAHHANFARIFRGEEKPLTLFKKKNKVQDKTDNT